MSPCVTCTDMSGFLSGPLFLTAGLWTTALFAVSCDVELKYINPLTALVIPLHEGVRIIDEYRAGLQSPVSFTTIQSYVGKKIKEIAVPA